MGRSIDVNIVKTEKGVTIKHDQDAVTFSAANRCPALEVIVHDDDFLVYTLYVDGKPIDHYNSCPGYFDDGDTVPEGGNASALATAFGKLENEGRIHDILHFDARGENKDERYVFETERLQDLIEALGGDPGDLEGNE